MKKILFVSGGIDSTLLLLKYKQNISDYIYFHYGQPMLDKEMKSIAKMGIVPKIIKLNLPEGNEKGFVYGRNLEFFLEIRKQMLDKNIGVYFGNNADDNYNDNTREFLARAEKIINDSYPLSTLRIICPLENYTKEDIVQELNKELLKLNPNEREKYNPYYCDSGEDKPCKKCHSCQAMIDANLI